MEGHRGVCKCRHHWLVKLLMLFAWVAAVGFWWVEWKGGVFLGVSAWNAQHLFRDVVIFVLLIFTTKFCGCCDK